jgi:hypothetical protein
VELLQGWHPELTTARSARIARLLPLDEIGPIDTLPLCIAGREACRQLA